MRALLSTLEGSEIDVPGVGVVRLRHATVREALRVLVAIEDITLGRGLEALADACKTWLPSQLHRFYFGEESFVDATLKDIGALLSAGVTDRARHERDQDELETEAQRRSWSEILADYADTCGPEPEKALEQPWPFFVMMCAEARRLQARRQAAFMVGYVIARSGDEKLWQQAMDAAGYRKPVSTARYESPGEEWEREQWEKIRAYNLRMGRTRYYRPKSLDPTRGEA